MKLPKVYSQDESFASIGKFKWRCTRLFELAKDLPVMEIPIDHLNLADKLTVNPPRLRRFATEMKLVMEADLKYPIILDEDGEIMDGRHRIVKALYLGKKTIKAVRFETDPEPCETEKD